MKQMAIVFLILTSGLAAADDNYERSRQCAARAEKIMPTFGDKSLGIQASLARSHYSPKYDRCYMLVHYYAPDAHLHTDALFNAFEVTLLASKNLSDPPHTRAKEWCHVSDGSYHADGCEAYEAYIEDHLEK